MEGVSLERERHPRTLPGQSNLAPDLCFSPCLQPDDPPRAPSALHLSGVRRCVLSSALRSTPSVSGRVEVQTTAPKIHPIGQRPRGGPDHCPQDPPHRSAAAWRSRPLPPGSTPSVSGRVEVQTTAPKIHPIGQRPRGGPDHCPQDPPHRSAAAWRSRPLPPGSTPSVSGRVEVQTTAPKIHPIGQRPRGGPDHCPQDPPHRSAAAWRSRPLPPGSTPSVSGRVEVQTTAPRIHPIGQRPRGGPDHCPQDPPHRSAAAWRSRPLPPRSTPSVSGRVEVQTTAPKIHPIGQRPRGGPDHCPQDPPHRSAAAWRSRPLPPGSTPSVSGCVGAPVWRRGTETRSRQGANLASDIHGPPGLIESLARSLLTFRECPINGERCLARRRVTLA
ncbi:basic salivary proline-rich protein 2-like [Brienomyrus brachyistius]|uniref:basic salivary proline-rich protein 2-like n=1 Tax=Brienomyrus brachyistius TaxID=42636 RepID=UPI0020B2425C|nr:basic salivary proline-rich protein 2-like [Brienomyrus brachyistius]